MSALHSSYLLAIETIGRSGSLALTCVPSEVGHEANELSMARSAIYRFRSLPDDRRTAVTVTEQIKRLLEDSEIDTPGESLVGIGVSIGPGSFTGIRIGVATAKALGYAWHLPVFPVDSLAAHVEDACFSKELSVDSIVSSTINAYRGQWYAQSYLCKDTSSKPPQSLVSTPESWMKTLADLKRDPANSEKTIWLAGDPEITQPLQSQLEGSQVAAPHELAAAVGRLALVGHLRGNGEQAMNITPKYIRPSAAEEKLNDSPNTKDSP
ncbi:MAG: tRNA (adenosine(37)-N6)-threonylcarbamoyltransferase complex dimerization subunit type 1 TsaB [Planctomycetota bacterium]